MLEAVRSSSHGIHAAKQRTSKKQLQFIVEAPDAASLKAMDIVEATGTAQIKARLPIIHGAAVQVDADKEADLRVLAQTLGMKVTADRKIGIPKRERVGAEVDLKKHLFAATRSMRAEQLWDQGIQGKGVTVAVIDTGVAPHKDLGNRIVGFHDFINGETSPYDDHGHGTHVSGTVAGDGKASHGFLKGVAPQASIVGVKVLDESGSGSLSGVIQGIQWAIENKDKYGIKVMNLSLGASVETTWKDDPVCQAIQAAEAAGILPVCAAGNSGPMPESIGTPANAPAALTVGAVDDRGTPWRWDDRMALFSSRGPTAIDALPKPDLAAPGVAIVAPKANTGGYTSMSGTSMASPMVAGAAALLLQAHPTAKPAEIKAALMNGAHHISGFSDKSQGKGEVDLPAALAELNQ